MVHTANNKTAFFLDYLTEHYKCSAYFMDDTRSIYYISLLLDRNTSAHIAAVYKLYASLANVVRSASGHREARQQLTTIKEYVTDHSLHGYTTLTTNIDIKTLWLIDLIDGISFYLERTRFADTDALLKYCYQIAGTLSLMLTQAYADSHADLPVRTMHLAMAVVLTDIIRNVWTDADNNRVYLPADLIGDMSPEAILHCTTTDYATLRYAIEKLIIIADNYYQSGYVGLGYLPYKDRFIAYLLSRSYHNIHVYVRAQQYITPGYSLQLNFSQGFSSMLFSMLRFLRSIQRLNDYDVTIDTLFQCP